MIRNQIIYNKFFSYLSLFPKKTDANLTFISIDFTKRCRLDTEASNLRCIPVFDYSVHGEVVAGGRGRLPRSRESVKGPADGGVVTEVVVVVSVNKQHVDGEM